MKPNFHDQAGTKAIFFLLQHKPSTTRSAVNTGAPRASSAQAVVALPSLTMEETAEVAFFPQAEVRRDDIRDRFTVFPDFAPEYVLPQAFIYLQSLSYYNRSVLEDDITVRVSTSNLC